MILDTELKYIISVNSYKRPVEIVERCLRACFVQRIPPIEIVLIDQNEPALELSSDIIAHPLFRYLRIPVSGVSEARNNLPINSEAEWIFFCDDDGYPAEDYSDRMLRILAQNPALEIIAGSIVDYTTNNFYTERHSAGGKLMKFRNTKILMGSNLLVKPGAFIALGKFDEQFGTGSLYGSSEETDFCWKAYFAKTPMEFFRELQVYHPPPLTMNMKKEFVKSFRYGVGKGALVYKWLVKRGKLLALYEFWEMLFIVPVYKTIKSIITLQPNLLTSTIAAVAGRVSGFIYAAYRHAFVRNA
jgi:GT2 family glycosyltransferase